MTEIIAEAKPAGRVTGPARLGLLRAELARRGLDGFIIPRSDEHQGEYVPPSAQRLAWLTGFTGSAGVAVALAHDAALFTDGRYTLQAAAEVDATAFKLLHVTEQPPHEWIAETLRAGAKLGYDPWLHTPDGVERLRTACAKAGATLVPCPDNPLDAVWSDRPAPPTAPFTPHPVAYAGQDAAEKREEIAAALKADKIDAAFLSAPDSIAWLLNIRGGDVPYAPMPLAFAILHADARVELFADSRKLSPEVNAHLGAAVTIRTPADLGAALDALAKHRVRINSGSAPAWVFDRLTSAGAEIVRGADPCQLPKACKNDVEMAGMRSAHLRDGVAVVRFLSWLEKIAPKGKLTEMEAADRLEQFRAESDLFRGLSFPTIAGAGPNGAIVHYRAMPETNRRIEKGQIFLLDSGGQYLDGTTDITRTLAIGKVPGEEKRRFTLVLKGHIALAMARFPDGTTGSQLDALARNALWREGLDFDHGTGHGVGSYLSVHEGPQRISKMANSQPLMPGMVVSDEPGYYKAGAYGIRIENLVAVRRSELQVERPVLEFEVLTLVPIDLNLVERKMLEESERDWLNTYHATVRAVIGPKLDGIDAAWLQKATRAI